MASSTLALYDPQYAYVPTLAYPDTSSEDGAGDTFKLPHTFYFYPPYFNLDEQISDGFPGSPCMEQCGDYTHEFYLAEYQGDLLTNNDHEHWPNGSDLFFSWSRSFFAVGDDLLHDNGGHTHGSDSGQSDAGLLLRDDQVNGSNHKEEDTQSQIECVYETSSGYWSWLEKQLEECSQGYDSWEEPRASADKFEFCENMFGYWPCMSRE